MVFVILISYILSFTTQREAFLGRDFFVNSSLSLRLDLQLYVGKDLVGGTCQLLDIGTGLVAKVTDK